MRFALLVTTLGLACGPSEPRPPACGLPTEVGAPQVILRMFSNVRNVVLDPPTNLPTALPTRVVVTGEKSDALVGYGEAGVVIGFQGADFPVSGGFGILVVDDSTSAYTGVMVFESARPGEDFPTLGIVSGRTGNIPLYGVRVPWRELSNPRCPLLGQPEPAEART